MDINEDDIPAKETFQSESSWIQSKNGHSRWKKSSCSKKSKGKKSIISIGHIYVYRKGKPYGNKYLVMYLLANDLGRNRVGISVSKKVGNSIIRHHLTRLIRESYRLHEEQFQCGYDIVIIARTTAKDRSYHEIESALIHLGKLHHIYSDCN